ncbi:hypothetical protein EVA_22727, partial [gut metagenome]
AEYFFDSDDYAFYEHISSSTFFSRLDDRLYFFLRRIWHKIRR